MNKTKYLVIIFSLKAVRSDESMGDLMKVTKIRPTFKGADGVDILTMTYD